MEEYPEVALYKPQIPQNTGNIGRTTLGFNTKLHLIDQLGFSLDNKYLKRAGLDYWEKVKLEIHEDFSNFYKTVQSRKKKIYCLSKYGRINLAESKIERNSILLFGQEQFGMDKDLLKEYSIDTVYIKVLGGIRSYNLSNAVAMTLYDVYNKNGLM